MNNMNCAYHEDRESLRQCAECSKPLCEDCIHADYSAYCWSCGYEHEQKLIEEEKSLVYPAFLEHKVIYYVLHKAFSAVGASILGAFAFSILLSVLSGFEAMFMVMVLYIGLFVLLITSTYGILCSLLIDIIAHYVRFARNRIVLGVLYLIGGLSFPYLTDMYKDSELSFYLVLCGGTALLFFLLQTVRLDKRLVIGVGMLSLIVMIIVCSSCFNFIKELWH
jgi:hypothetical protein